MRRSDYEVVGVGTFLGLCLAATACIMTINCRFGEPLVPQELPEPIAPAVPTLDEVFEELLLLEDWDLPPLRKYE
ncbi:MAG: hypothetical protein U1E51_19400 [Candidatus Binatia bacterium]|nr:hypothetical protein [Candidatus Binatia bacterium]